MTEHSSHGWRSYKLGPKLYLLAPIKVAGNIFSSGCSGTSLFDLQKSVERGTVNIVYNHIHLLCVLYACILKCRLCIWLFFFNTYPWHKKVKHKYLSCVYTIHWWWAIKKDQSGETCSANSNANSLKERKKTLTIPLMDEQILIQVLFIKTVHSLRCICMRRFVSQV